MASSMRAYSGAFTSCSTQARSASPKIADLPRLGSRLSIPNLLSCTARLPVAARRRSILVSRTSANAEQSVSTGSTLGETLKTLTDAQRQLLAQEWGYTQLGAPLPEGVTLSVLARSIPDKNACFDAKRLLLGLAAPLTLMACGYAWMWFMHSIIPGWQQAACWLLIGTGYFGVFTLGHEAARLALLPGSPGLQSAIGSALLAPSLYSLEAWRVGIMVHYNQTNMLGEDSAAWQPVTKQQLSRMSAAERMWTRLACTTPLKLLGSIAHWLSSFGGLDLKRYYEPMRATMILSWAVPFWFAGVVWPAMIASGGISAWFDCWLMPWLVFHMWLSTLTLLHHTAPHVPFEGPGDEYDPSQAVVNGTTTVKLPSWLEFILNYANYHLPQHIRGQVPFYHAQEATEAIRQKLGPYLTEATLNGRLVRNLIEKWQVYDEEKKTYVTFQQASREVEAEAQAAGLHPRGSPVPA